MESYLLLILLAGLVTMDTTAGPQMLFSEPIVSCSIAGFLMGHPETGLMIGVFFQLLWFGHLPLGAVRLPDGNLGALIAGTSLIGAIYHFGLSEHTARAAMIPAILWGVFAGGIGSRVQDHVRRVNSRITDAIIRRIENGGIPHVGYWHVRGCLSSFARGVVISAVLIPLGVGICAMTDKAPVMLVDSLAFASPMLWGTAFASAIIVSLHKGGLKSVALGAAGGIVWLLMTILGSG